MKRLIWDTRNIRSDNLQRVESYPLSVPRFLRRLTNSQKASLTFSNFSVSGRLFSEIIQRSCCVSSSNPSYTFNSLLAFLKGCSFSGKLLCIYGRVRCRILLGQYGMSASQQYYEDPSFKCTFLVINL